MTAIQFALGLARLVGIVVPAVLIARILRIRCFATEGSLAALTEVVLGFSVVVVVGEALGLVALMRPAALIPVLVLLAGIMWRFVGGPTPKPAAVAPDSATRHPRPGRDLTSMSALVAAVVVSAQWCVQTANALGAGMANFDTLWYHMPFAAHMAQTSSVTGIQFTQADPYVAYFPANSELFHALGIEALGGDLLSPVLNLLWLAVALLAAWCLGRPWRVERLTLIACSLVLSLPVLSGTQPGEAFNDIVGLAMLVAAAALVVNAPRDRRLLIVAGLALGFAIGTKFTFVVPGIVLVLGIAASARSGSRRRALGALALPLLLTGGWWYLRNLIAVGNPEGLRLHLGPLALPGPTSPLANAAQQTIASEIGHVSLWGSRFLPGLDHALGPLWPVVLVLYLGGCIAGVTMSDSSVVRVIAVVAAVSGISYLVLPTGATGIEQSSELFQVNLRYATPALVLAITLVPVIVQMRAPRLLPALAAILVAVLLVAQFEHELWPTQPLRHLVAFAVVAALAVVVPYGVQSLRRLSRPTLASVALGSLLVLVAAAFAVQRHYFDRRYLTGYEREPALGAIYRWAQGVSHSRIALYGNVQQYPLYGAHDTNEVAYLGAYTGDGDFRPIASCQAWRSTLNEGHYQYLVLTPAPTAPIPVAWTQTDPAAHLVLRPASNAFIFKLEGTLSASRCSYR